MLQAILAPVLIIGGLGLLFGLGLAVASKKFEVQVDERITKIREILPGANCAACGQTGCDAYAEAVIDGRSGPDKCSVGGTAVAVAIAEILGIEAGTVEARTARVMCSGSLDKAKTQYAYEGIEDCTAAAVLHGGPMACSYGCVGMGSCVKACPFGAIVVENGLARVIQSRCTGCTKCVAVCPKKIIRMVPCCAEYSVRCSSLDKGPVVKKNCDVGCIGCGKCSRVCEAGAIKLHGALAEIDPALCTNCGACREVCPTGSILKSSWMGIQNDLQINS